MKEAIIDTDILSYYLKGDIQVIKRFAQYLQEHPQLNISIITQFEILGGLEYKKANKQIEKFDEFSLNCNVPTLSEISIRLSAEIFGSLRRKGISISTSDILIAGQALEHGWVLATNNEKHFSHIEGLETANWKKG